MLRSADLAPILLVLVGLGLRLWRIDLTQFDLDQSTLLGHAAAFAAGGSIPQSSGLSFTIGVREPPLTTFLLTPPMFFTRDPVWASAYQAAADAFGAIFVWLGARDLGGRRAALAAGLLYAVSPAAIVFSRRIWNPDWVPLFSALALWGAIGFARFGDPRRLAASLFGVACATQLHPTAVVLSLPVLALAVARWRDVAWRPLGVAGLGLLLLIIPYLRLQQESGWADLQAVADYLVAPKGLAWEVPYEAASLIVGDFLTQAGEHRDQNWRGLLEPAALTLAVAIAIGVAAALRGGSPGWVAVSWLLLPILASFRSIRWVEPHYLLAILPAAALLAGLGIAALRPRYLGSGLLAVMVLWRVVDVVRFQDAVAALDVGPAYGVPLRYTLEAARQAVQLHEMGAEPPNPRDGTPVFVGYPYAYGGFVHYLTQDRFPITHFDSRDTLILRRSGGLYLVTAGGQAEKELATRFGAPVASVNATTGQPVYVLYRLTESALAPYFSAPPPDLSPLDADIGHLAQMWGYRAFALVGGQSSGLMLAWQVKQADDPRWEALTRVVELRDGTGRRWSTEARVAALVTNSRREGDLVFSSTGLEPRADTPTGGYSLEVAFVEQSGQRLAVYAGSQAIDDALRLGPVKVAGTSPQDIPARGAPDLAVLGNQEVALESAKLEGASVRLVWRALTKPAESYTVFVHALDAEGQVVAQHDSPPVNGTYPTSLWDVGERVADIHDLRGELGAARSLAVGLYRRPSLERLPVADGSGSSLGDHVLVRLP